MKKNILMFSSLLVLCAQSFAQDSLVIRLQGEVSRKGESFRTQTIELKSLNPQLESIGVRGFSESIALTETNQESMTKFKKKLHMASRLLNLDSLDFIGHDVNDFRGYIDYETPEMCYTGNPAKVIDIINAHVGILFSDEMTICGSKLGNKTDIVYDDCLPLTEERAQEYIDNEYEDAVDAWTNYSGNPKELLLMTNWGSQGDGVELFPTTIKECK
jgi:hypothetical protein